MSGDRTAGLYEAHRQAIFPSRLRAVDVAGVETVMLDANVAGCVNTWLSRGGDLDNRRWSVLAAREQELIRVVPSLAADEARYYQRLWT